MASGLVIAKGETELALLPSMTNRHGLVAGATGTGKTVTLQKIAGELSNIGVPVFMADIKGDLSGISRPGGNNPKVEDRIKTLSLKGFKYEGNPVVFWDVFGQSGHPIRTTVSEMGPLLISRLLGLNDVQEGVLATVFKIADDNGLLLLDLKDLRSMLQNVGENAKVYTTEYGNIPVATIGTIQRGLLTLEEQGGDQFFAEPAFDIDDLIKVEKGKGVVNILAADKLITSPKVYSTFLLYLLSELFEEMPEAGDLDKPKLVFFFDEAHLLFRDAPKALTEKIEQVVRLIRSKGVGVYFITQNPLDVPESVLGQLGNRVQHALRAFTPMDQKAVNSAAKTFRPNPKLKVEQVITELGVGEALVSFLDEKGAPGIVQRAYVIPPGSKIGPIAPQERSSIMSNSDMAGKYDKVFDRESAYELLQKKAKASAAQAAQAAKAAEKVAATKKAAPKGRQRQSAASKLAVSAGREVQTQIIRGLLGSMFKKR